MSPRQVTPTENSGDRCAGGAGFFQPSFSSAQSMARGSTCETVSAGGGSRTPSPPTVSSSSIGTADEDHPGLCRTTRRRACHRPVQRDLRGESDTRHQSRGPGSQLLDRREHRRRDRRRRHRPGHSGGGAVHHARQGQWPCAAPPQSRQRRPSRHRAALMSAPAR